MIHAYKGQRLIIDKHVATKLATATYKGDAKVKAVNKLAPPLANLPKEKNNVWQVNFNDAVILVFTLMQALVWLLVIVMMINALLISFLCCTLWIMVW